MLRSRVRVVLLAIFGVLALSLAAPATEAASPPPPLEVQTIGVTDGTFPFYTGLRNWSETQSYSFGRLDPTANTVVNGTYLIAFSLKLLDSSFTVSGAYCDPVTGANTNFTLTPQNPTIEGLTSACTLGTEVIPPYNNYTWDVPPRFAVIPNTDTPVGAYPSVLEYRFWLVTSPKENANKAPGATFLVGRAVSTISTGLYYGYQSQLLTNGGAK